MLIVPTGEFVGILSDVIPLSTESKDAPHYGLLLEWNGHQLSAHASDSLSAGVSTYDPDDPTDFDTDVNTEHVNYGPTSEDEPPWKVFLSLDDAKETVKTFKLAWKFRAVPLNIKVNAMGNRLIIERTRDTGKTEHVMSMQPTGAHLSFKDIRAEVRKLMNHLEPKLHCVVWGHRLAAFEHASRRGPVALVFSVGNQPVVVKVGNRFVGYVTPERDPQRDTNVLRTGSSVLAGDGAGPNGATPEPEFTR